jgi:AraC-like DNA-binding protein
VRYREVRPRPPLDRFLECFWFVDADPPSAESAPERIVPDGCPELIVHLADSFECVDERGSGERQPRSLLVGTLTRPLQVRPQGRVRTMGVRFRPFGLSAFLPVPLHELKDRFTSLADIWNGTAGDLEEVLVMSASDAERVGLVERFLCARQSPEVDGTIQAAVATILRARGQARLEPLARDTGLSLRQIERRFRDAVGVGPKALSRLVRFQEVLRRLSGDEPWVDVALDCGYYDQAHLIRDFRGFVGLAPSRFRAAEGDLARQFTSPARLDRFFA